jgi:hypothetical protein
MSRHSKLTYGPFGPLLLAFALFTPATAGAEDLPVVDDVEPQPFKAQADRVLQALDMLGVPPSAATRDAVREAMDEPDAAKSVAGIQRALDPLCLAAVHVNPESRVKVTEGPAPRSLAQHGWRVFLVKVYNDAGVTAKMRLESPNAAPVFKRSSGSPDPAPAIKPAEVSERWLDVDVYDRQPLAGRLSGLKLEYRVVQLYSRDAGKREAKLMFDVGQGTQDLGFRNEINVLFDCQPAVKVELEVLDADGKTPTTGQFVFRDGNGRVYPAQGRRLAPDFFFHAQVYRHSGEPILLPPGVYDVSYGRGPEYRNLNRKITVPAGRESHKESFKLERWIKLADKGWYSGDHHIHAAGCAHYESPTEGVTPQDMMRHVLGEDLNVGCVLSWGPCWYAQKKFFDGKLHPLSTDRNLMRYDIEVSGFPSSHAGHLCLLRLKEDDYPGTGRIEQWPSWDLPVLKWGKEQGSVVGFSHSGWGLKVNSTELPNYEMPPFDGIGANEYIVDVAHNAVDFISAVDTPVIWEMNIWYHTLNCGYRTRISGETDFPCIYGERVGLGRSYVKVEGVKPGEQLDFDRWVDGIRDGRSYVGDGLSHLYDLSVGGLAVGEKGEGGRPSALAAKAGEPLKVAVKAAAMLEPKPREDIRGKRLDQAYYWHVERARVGQTRKVSVELVVNGKAVARKEIEADGSVQDVTFDFTPRESSWVALRVFPSSHTNPVFVEVDGKPIRASRKSAEWCLKAVDVCWNAKKENIRPEERGEAAKAYEVARQAYRKILAEATAD